MGILNKRVEDVDNLLLGERINPVLKRVFDVEPLVENLVGADAPAQIVSKYSQLVGERFLVLGE